MFTGTRIEGEDGSAIKVAIIDAATDEVVLYAPESSAKVEIVVLEGDFDSDEGENWTLEEFKNNIVREREGKKPLLTGDVHLFLKEGTGSVGEISFTDNSSWTRSRRFRLGARVVANSDGARIREAKTESFIVRDHRGECEYLNFLISFYIYMILFYFYKKSKINFFFPMEPKEHLQEKLQLCKTMVIIFSAFIYVYTLVPLYFLHLYLIATLAYTLSSMHNFDHQCLYSISQKS